MTAIMKARNIQVVPIPNAQGTRWAAKTIDGTRAGPNRATFSTPEEAVEAAEQRFLLADARTQEAAAQRIVAAMERGRYYIRSRVVQSTDPEGNPITARLFSAFQNGNPVPSVQDRISFTQAVIDMEKLLP